MTLRRATPNQPTDDRGRCRHLYLTGDATCVHCGMKFRLAWASERKRLLGPALRNLLVGVGFGLLIVGAQAMALGALGTVFLMGAVLFFTRTLLGGFELYTRHGFIPGELGPVSRRSRLNPMIPKPFVTTIGTVRFPIDGDVHSQFNEGDVLLVEHLRWSRIMVAIYVGTLD